MDPPTGKAPQQCDSVRVAVNVRPLITHELLMGCTDCVTVAPGEPQVQIGSHAFTYDHVYGSSGSPSSAIYDECVARLVDALFHGYNATVLAYGQTGSGKTYTMGTNYTGDERSEGIIPKVMEHIFQKVESKKANTEFLIRVSFIEIFKEEVFDLLDPNHGASRGEGAVKTAGPARVPIQIRETVNGGITLAGVTEAEVCSKQEMASFLARGSLSRATASTNMNNQSSRSHAIFTVSMEMKSRNSGSGSVPEEDGDDILCAKLHLVDLAGSERAKRTGADGLRLKEGIHINRGLLALGNVISALGDEKKRKEGVHVPYRDSKLTRLLQDSLGGNSKTVMIACVSPADTNAEETINTLKYANRARNIQNKAVVNRDPMNAQMQKMRSQLEQLQAELLYFRGGGGSHDELQVLQHKIQLLETRNVELCQELNTRQLTCECLEKRAMEAQLEKDKLFLKLESFKNGRPWTENDDGDNRQDFDLLKTYVSRIQDLEMKLLQMESVSNSRRNAFLDALDLEDDGLQARIDLPSLGDSSSCCEGVDDDKEMEHSTLQDKFGRELQELNKQLEQKEEEMKQISTLDTSVLRQHYEKKILDMEQEKKALQKEIEDLQGMLANLSLASDDGAQKLKQEYLKKLNALEAQVCELKKKQEAQSHTLRQKQRSEEAAKRLQEEIQRIKTQKVQLQHKIKQESEQFRLWKASREKEVLQLKKEGRRNEYEMHKLLALNQRQKMVLQRKTEEASLATKRLKELLEAKKTSRESSGSGTASGPGIQALIQAIEHELEVTVRVHEVRSQYGRQLEARSAMANELSKLKDEELLRQKNMSASHTLSPSARNSRIIALENMLATSSSTLVTMASQLSEAEERERVFAGRGRWNQVRSLPEAKSLMNFLSELASSSRCQLRDVEIASREKDSVIKELKEKILSLNLTVKQLEAQKAVLVSLDKPKAPRKSTVFNTNVSNTDLEEDMDLSESEQSDQGCSEAESDEDWVDSRKRMPRKRSRLASRSTRSSADGFASERPKLEILDEAATQEVVGSVQKTCCSCSKYSLCKTKKCECRATNGFCGQLCGCLPSKCSNREGATNNESEETSPSESMEHSDSERTSSLAHQGALLLKSALSEKPTVKNEGREGTEGRRPLSDIGNKTANSTTAKPTKRKNWRKSVIQIVPVVQLPPNPPEAENNNVHNNEPPRLRETLPLKLPRAMASVKNNNHPLAERNSMNSNNHAGSVRFTQDSDEKENDRA